MLKVISGIYLIICIKNGKYYTGSSYDMHDRKNEHLRELRGKYHGNPHLQAAFDVYGENSFIFLILEEGISRENLLKVEQTYLDVAKTQKHLCFNICFIAGRGPEMTEKIKERMRKLWKIKYQNGYINPRKGKTNSKEHKKNLSITHKKLYENGYVNPNKDKPMSKEQKKKKK